MFTIVPRYLFASFTLLPICLYVLYFHLFMFFIFCFMNNPKHFQPLLILIKLKILQKEKTKTKINPFISFLVFCAADVSGSKDSLTTHDSG